MKIYLFWRPSYFCARTFFLDGTIFSPFRRTQSTTNVQDRRSCRFRSAPRSAQLPIGSIPTARSPATEIITDHRPSWTRCTDGSPRRVKDRRRGEEPWECRLVSLSCRAADRGSGQPTGSHSFGTGWPDRIGGGGGPLARWRRRLRSPIPSRVPWSWRNVVVCLKSPKIFCPDRLMEIQPFIITERRLVNDLQISIGCSQKIHLK